MTLFPNKVASQVLEYELSFWGHHATHDGCAVKSLKDVQQPGVEPQDPVQPWSGGWAERVCHMLPLPPRTSCVEV